MVGMSALKREDLEDMIARRGETVTREKAELLKVELGTSDARERTHLIQQRRLRTRKS